MGVIYDVVADAESHAATATHSFGARTTRAAAEAHLAAEEGRYAGSAWRDFRIEEVDTAGLFAIPSRPSPRERYTTRITPRPGAIGVAETVDVEVFEGERLVSSYHRNYAMLQTFEPAG